MTQRGYLFFPTLKWSQLLSLIITCLNANQATFSQINNIQEKQERKIFSAIFHQFIFDPFKIVCFCRNQSTKEKQLTIQRLDNNTIQSRRVQNKGGRRSFEALQTKVAGHQTGGKKSDVSGHRGLPFLPTQQVIIVQQDNT